MKLLNLIVLMALALSLHAQEIVRKENLKEKDNRTYTGDSEKLFTGIAATYHMNGQPYSYVYIEDGKKTGKIEIFFDSGSKRVVTWEDENHTNYGKVHIWNEDGTPAFEGEWVDGRLFMKGSKEAFTGEISVRYKNGSLNEKSEFREGYWHGRQVFMDREGKVISDCFFEKNQIVDCKMD